MDTKHDLTEIRVKNLGPLIDCVLKVKPLTVFVGPSNTGKSVLAILLYALHRRFSEVSKGTGAKSLDFYQNIRQIYGVKANSIEKQIQTSLSDGIKAAQADNPNPNEDLEITIPSPVIKIFQHVFEKEAKDLSETIQYCFGMSIHQLIRHRSRAESSICINTQSTDHDAFYSLKYSLKSDKTESESTKSIKVKLDDREELLILQSILNSTSRKDEDTNEFSDETFLFWRVCNRIYRIITSIWIGTFSNRAFYLPADRTGIMHAHSTLVSSLIERAPLGGIKGNLDTPLLTGVLADFLERLITKETKYSRNRLDPGFPNRVSSKSVSKIGSKIEDEILGGRIFEERNVLTNYPEFRYQPCNWENSIPLTNSSSMISELASLVLYLRNHVRPGDFLIVEEPESHLHPAKQVEFMRLLANLVNLKVKVVLTTHSEWIVEEISNIVQRADYKGSKRNSHSLKLNAAIPAQDIGVWLFSHKVRNSEIIGSAVSEVHVDENGLYPTKYESVSEELHNEWASLHNRS